MAAVFRSLFSVKPVSRVCRPCFSTLTSNQDDPTGGVPLSKQIARKAKETRDAVYYHFDMPGIGKEHLEVHVQNNWVVIEGQKQESVYERARRYSARISIQENFFKIDEIKGEMKDGVLKLVIPKLKKEDIVEPKLIQVPIH